MDNLTKWIFFDTLLNSNCNSMLLSKTDAKEILSIVKKFSNKSYLDCNDMSMSINKEIIPFVVSPFTYICNLSFYSGDFPNAIKFPKYKKMVQRMNLTIIDPYHY